MYLKDNTRFAEFIDDINERFSEGVLNTTNTQELLTAQLSMYGSIFLAVASVLLAVTILVIFLVLYLLLRTVIVRRRRELGIQKALGFTTLQLMNQLVLYFIPVIALGVVVGGLLGSIGLNPIFVALIQGMGIMTASMPTPLELVAVLCAALVLLAYLFALLITWRIRRISAYALIVE